MKITKSRTYWWMVTTILGFWVAVPHSGAVIFSDSTRVNVLRQYDPVGNFLVTESVTGTGLTGVGGNDGSGKPNHWQITGSGTGISTYTLPGPRTVGSFRAEFNDGSHMPTGGMLIEGLSGGVWVTLTNITTVTPVTMGSFTPQTVTQIRYTLTGPGTGAGHIQNNEFQVYLAPGQTVYYEEGYNILRDAGKVIAVTDSVTSGPWNARTSLHGGNAAYDADYFGGHVHGSVGRVFFALTLDQPTKLNAGHLGWFEGQSWSDYQVYSSAAPVQPPIQSLSGTDVATLTAAGWTLQLTTNAAVQRLFFNFAGGDGPWKHLLVVWNGSGALVEFEAYNLVVPEPSTALLLAVGGLLIWRRVKK